MQTASRHLAALAALAMASVAFAADWYVSIGMDYGADVVDAAHRTNDIQAAIYKAAQNDVVWVADGFVCDSGTVDVSGTSYRLSSSKALTLRSQGGDWRTGPTIRGSRDETAPVGGFAKTAVNAKVQIIGFNFVDCAIPSGDGGGVRGNGGGASGYNLTLRSCRLSNCKASNGGGVQVGGDSGTFAMSDTAAVTGNIFTESRLFYYRCLLLFTA